MRPHVILAAVMFDPAGIGRLPPSPELLRSLTHQIEAASDFGSSGRSMAGVVYSHRSGAPPAIVGRRPILRVVYCGLLSIIFLHAPTLCCCPMSVNVLAGVSRSEHGGSEQPVDRGYYA